MDCRRAEESCSIWILTSELGPLLSPSQGQRVIEEDAGYKGTKTNSKDREKATESEEGEGGGVGVAAEAGEGGCGGQGEELGMMISVGEEWVMEAWREMDTVVESETVCHCVDCGKKILTAQTCVQCDGCGFWHHTSCEKVQDYIFSFLSDHNGEPSLLWYCRKCIATCKKMTTMMLMMHEQQSHLEEKVNDLARNMQQKLDEVVKELNKKLDEKETEKSLQELNVSAESRRNLMCSSTR